MCRKLPSLAYVYGGFMMRSSLPLLVGLILALIGFSIQLLAEEIVDIFAFSMHLFAFGWFVMVAGVLVIFAWIFTAKKPVNDEI